MPDRVVTVTMPVVVHEPGPDERTCVCDGSASAALHHLARIYEICEDGWRAPGFGFIETRLYYFWLQHPEAPVVRA